MLNWIWDELCHGLLRNLNLELAFQESLNMECSKEVKRVRSHRNLGRKLESTDIQMAHQAASKENKGVLEGQINQDKKDENLKKKLFK